MVNIKTNIPKITVIIPIGPDRKMEALGSLNNQQIPVEIIVKKGTNPSKNRNDGASEAKTQLIAFMDAHSTAPSDWSRKVIEFFNKNPSVDLIGGPQLNPPEETYIGKVSGYALGSLFGSSTSSSRYKSKKPNFNANEQFVTSANLICRKKVTQNVKFDENLYPGEDPKFIYESKKNGFKLAYIPSIFLYHRRRSTTGDLARQVFKYGYVRPKKESITETLVKPSFMAPSLFLIYLVLFPILTLLSYLTVIPLILYLILSLYFSLTASIMNKNLIAFFILPFIFFLIHVSYGLGFIYGLIKK